MKKFVAIMLVLMMALAMVPAMAEVTHEFTLEKDVVLPDKYTPIKCVEEGATYVLNLNGYTISAPEDASGDGIFYVANDATLIINGPGKIDAATDKNDYAMCVWANGGNVIINGGTFTNVGSKMYDDDHFLNNNEVIYVRNGGSAIINGGEFIGNNPKFTLNSHDTNTGTIVVNGGIFHDYDPANSNTEPGGPVSFVNPSATVIEKNGEYIVVMPTEDIPETGDEATIILWSAMILLAGAALLVMKKKSYNY